MAILQIYILLKLLWLLMFRFFFYIFFFGFIALVASCSMEDQFVQEEIDPEVNEQLNKNWDLYAAQLPVNLDSALFYMLQLHDIATETGNEKWLASAEWAIADIYTQQGLYGEAVFSLLKAAKLKQKLGKLHDLANVYTSLGDAYTRAGDFSSAVSYFSQAKDIFIYEGSSGEKAMILRNLGIYYYKSGRYKEAKDHLLQAEKIAVSTSEYHWLSLIYNSLGVMHFEQKDYAKAQEYYGLTIQYSDSLPHGDWQKSLAYNNKGEAYFHEGRHAEAVEWLNKAIILGEQEKIDPVLILNSRNLLAQLFIEEYNYHGAIALLEEGLEGFDAAVVDKAINKSLVLINKALLGINKSTDPAQYAEMNKLLVASNERLLEYNSRASGFDEKLEKITQQQAIYAAAERYAYNEQLVLATDKAAKMKNLFLIPVFLLVCALIWVYFAFRRNRHYKKLYSNIERILNKSKALRHLPKN